MSYAPVPYTQPQYPAIYQQSVQAVDPADSVGSWMLAQFLVGIPVVGFIYLLVVAFGGSASVSRQNWARATFAWMLISIAIGVVAFLVFWAMARGELHS